MVEARTKRLASGSAFASGFRFVTLVDSVTNRKRHEYCIRPDLRTESIFFVPGLNPALYAFAVLAVPNRVRHIPALRCTFQDAGDCVSRWALHERTVLFNFGGWHPLIIAVTTLCRRVENLIRPDSVLVSPSGRDPHVMVYQEQMRSAGALDPIGYAQHPIAFSHRIAVEIGIRHKNTPLVIKTLPLVRFYGWCRHVDCNFSVTRCCSCLLPGPTEATTRTMQ